MIVLLLLGGRIRKCSSEPRVFSAKISPAKAVPAKPKEMPTAAIKTAGSFLTILSGTLRSLFRKEKAIAPQSPIIKAIALQLRYRGHLTDN